MNIVKVLRKYNLQILFIVFFAVLLLITSCEQYKLNQSNFSLNGDYDHRYLFNKSNNAIVIDTLVLDYEITGDSLFVLRMISESIDCYDEEGIPTIMTHYSDVEEYWYINLENDEVDGPFNKASFIDVVKRIGLSDVELEVPNTYASNSEYFEKSVSKCAMIK